MLEDSNAVLEANLAAAKTQPGHHRGNVSAVDRERGKTG